MRISQKLCLSFAVVGVVAFAFVGSAAAKPSSERPFEIAPGSFHMIPSTGEAAAHENLTTEFDFTHNGSGQTYDDVRSTVVNLPAGLQREQHRGPDLQRRRAQRRREYQSCGSAVSGREYGRYDQLGFR